MLPELNKIKGIHPGTILKRELKSKQLKSSALAAAIDEHKQTISAILNKRRSINPKLSIKLAEVFHVEKDYFMLLQSSFDVKVAAASEPKLTPDLNKFRKVLFWDTTFDKMDWKKNKISIIKRVLERGNKTEINEIISFYGKETVSKAVKSIKTSRLPSFEKNISEYNLIEDL